jgi:serine/threonine-protein kinase
MSLQPGDVVGGRYRVDQAVGGGGFGTVYRATQLNLGRPVAIKVLHATLLSTEAALTRFRREAELAQQLRHPNTVRVFDFGQTDHGSPYIVWEYLEGQPLNRLIEREGCMSPQRVAHVAGQILKALMEAHALGIVHRDVKPANVVVGDFAGEPDFVKVLDFGVAKALGESGMTMTDGATPLGTPSYMAPEQVRNEQVTPAADLYALGLTMAEMLSGRVVFQGRTLIDVFMAQASEAPAPLPPEVLGSPLAPVIQRAAAKSLAQRYGTAGEMLRDLEHAAATSMRSAAGLAPTYPGGSFAPPGPSAPPTPVSPYHQVGSTAPTVGATSGGVQVVTTAPASQKSGAGMIALAIFGGLVAVGVIIAGAAGVLYMAASSGAKSEPKAAGAAPTLSPAPAGGGGPVELGARSGKGFDGFGPTTAAKRLEPAGWEKVGDTIKNIEGTYTSSIVGIQKGTRRGELVLYRFDDDEECAEHEKKLSGQAGSAARRDRSAIVQVVIPGDAAEAKRLLAMITG